MDERGPEALDEEPAIADELLSGLGGRGPLLSERSSRKAASQRPREKSYTEAKRGRKDSQLIEHSINCLFLKLILSQK